jgi:hypothetical protein
MDSIEVCLSASYMRDAHAALPFFSIYTLSLCSLHLTLALACGVLPS